MRRPEPAIDPVPAPLPIAPLDLAQRVACLRLIRSENVGPVSFRALINHFGGASQVVDALPEMIRRAGRRRDVKICTLGVAEAKLEAAERIGAVPPFTIEPGYPADLARVDVPPPLIYALGRIELLNRPCIAIVGSRESSANGVALARQFAQGLGVAGLVVVSGLARGIDGAAHQASLETGTIAVVAGGLDVIYPPEHAALHAAIATKGCIVSEQPPGFIPRGQDFPRRNRIIAGLSRGVVIVEAARRSGSLITARLAGELGREVLAVPGHPLDPRAEGTNQLLKDGATLVTTVTDVLDSLGPQLGSGGLNTTSFTEPLSYRLFAAPPPEEPVTAAEAVLPDDAIGRVLACLGPAPATFDDVARAAQLPARVAQAALLELSLLGRIELHGQQMVSLKA